MGKTNAEKQKAYRERMKDRLGEEFLKKERERVSTPAALLNKKELAVRRKQQNKWQRKCRALKKVQQTTLSIWTLGKEPREKMKLKRIQQ